MRIKTILIAALLCFGCSSSNNEDPTPDMGGTSEDASGGGDMSADDMTAADSGTAADDGPATFCETADCGGDTPICSPLLEACVECASNSDCATAPLLTCETMGVDGGDPSFACVECIDDSVCAGGTCDLDTHTCI